MDVDQVLQNINERQQKIAETITIDRNLQLDVGNLTAWDPNPLELPKAGKQREKYFLELARENVQSVLNKLYAIEDTEIKDGQCYLNLPDGTTKLPRGKHVPEPKQPTKWERFAQTKGINSNSSKDREKKVWDDTADQWKPRYGYKRAKLENEKEWLIEVPANGDPNIDYFAQKKEDKKERVAKNKFQQLRNKLN